MADDSSSGRAGLHPAFIGGAVLVLALLDFVLQNTDDVEINFLFFSTTKPLWLLLVVTSAIAIGAAEVIAFALRHRNR